jgi:hypothetical protein
MTISNYVGLTGRVLSYLNNNDSSIMPVSCTGTKYKDREHLFDLIKYIDIALRGGAGIAVNLDDFIQQPVNSYNFYFYLPETHPDYAQLNDEQKQRLFSLHEPNKLFQKEFVFIAVNDSMEEDDEYIVSIQNSWRVFIEALTEKNYVPIVDLSKLRPSGTSNSKGLTASGAVSFLTIYEAIINHLNKGDLISLMKLCGQMNEVLRRGGIYKNGIVTFNLNYKHRDIVKYLNVPLADIPGSGKKAIRIDDGILTNKRLMKLIEVRVNDKSLMLMKVVYQITDTDGTITYEKGKTLEYVINKYPLRCTIEELYAQVCVEILFKPNATCLLGHVNLGQIETLEQLTLAYNEVTELLIDLWKRWKNEVGGRGSQYLDASQDRQIGVGVFGLANLLAKFGITYKQHVEALTAYLTGEYYPKGTIEYKLAVALDNAYQSAAVLARNAGLERAFTIAPTQSCAYRYTDLAGNTTCRNINPPLARSVRRTSHTVADLAGSYYHGKVETIGDPYLVEKLWENWQELMNRTNLAHCMSYDLYHKVDADWLTYFLTKSPLVTTYYQVYDRIDQSYLNKAVAQIAAVEVEPASCAIADATICIPCSE